MNHIVKRVSDTVALVGQRGGVDLSPRVAYVLKVYPRFSQTFILNELIAHQAAQSPVEIFSLNRPTDGRFHASLALVESPVHYIDEVERDASGFWKQLHQAASQLPCLWPTLRQHGAEEKASVIQQALNLARQVREKRIDHLHAHFGRIATTVTRLAAKMSGVSYSFTAHARDIFHDIVRPDDLQRKLRDAALVVTVSQFNVDHLKKTFGPAASRVQLVYNGLNLPDFPYTAPSEREPLILAVGRLVDKKGFSDLVDACGELVRLGQRFRCRIVGTGPLESQLAARIQSLGLAEHVELMGPLPSHEVSRQLQRASVLAAPCIVAEDGDRDGLPTVLLEAMAVGTPCVSTDVTGIPEVLRHEETGLAVSQRDPQGLARACQRLIADAALRVRLAESARQQIDTDFDIHQNAARLRQLICVARHKADREDPIAT